MNALRSIPEAPSLLYSGNSGSIDIASTSAGAAAASLGDLSAVEFGKTYTYFQITMNRAFTDVIKSCASKNRTETWINEEIENLFISLNKMKYAHSIECWQKNQLVGGIYGVALGGVFFAESMFSCVSNGSKVALINLVARLWEGGFKILDVQFLNDHLIQFGAYEITKSKFSISKSSSFSFGLAGIGLVRGAAFVLPGFLPRLGRVIVVTSIVLPHSGHSSSVLPKS